MRLHVPLRFIAAMLSGALTLSCLTATSFAQETGEQWAQSTVHVSGDTYAPSSSLPVRFDLRDREGVITSVKFQSPYGSCWAFGGLAAAESSVNSDPDLSVKNIDFSERHLAWFAYQPIQASEDKDQAGEGLRRYGGHEFFQDANNIFNIGGRAVHVTSLLASGAGPVLETTFPYRGVNGWTNYDLCKDPDLKELWEQNRLDRLRKRYGDDQKILKAVRRLKGFEDVETIEEFLERARAYDLSYLENGSSRNMYSALDDWSIPFTDEAGNSNRFKSAGYVLQSAEFTPYFVDYNKKTKKTTINSDGMQAVKQELQAGRAVSVSLFADVSTPDRYGQSLYYNKNTAAQYVWQPGTGTNHTVCIVGWDDAYPASNFAGQVIQKKGSVTKPAPPGDGAWIIKNSWGKKDGTEDPILGGPRIGKSNYGIDGSGYFYVSYFDLSLRTGESFTFSRNLDNGVSFTVYQHDYMPGIGNSYRKRSQSVIASTNIFTAEADQRLVSVACNTQTYNTDVTYRIFRLNDDWVLPTEGEELAAFTKRCGYAGYHRHDLPVPVNLKKGDRFSVVVTKSYVRQNKKYYEVDAETAPSFERARTNYALFLEYNQKLIKAGKQPKPDEGRAYGVAVVNPLESMIYTEDDTWYDWSEYRDTEKQFSNGDVVADNFCIKAFATTFVPGEEPLYFKCIEGDNQKIGPDVHDLACTVACTDPEHDAYYRFLSAKIDRCELKDDDYVIRHVADKGLLTLTVWASCLQTLEPGSHTITITFGNGNSVEVGFTLLQQATSHTETDAAVEPINMDIPLDALDEEHPSEMVESGYFIDPSSPSEPLDPSEPPYEEDEDEPTDSTEATEPARHDAGGRDQGHSDSWPVDSRATNGVTYAWSDANDVASARGEAKPVRRISGADRYQTMAATVREGFERSDVVVVTSGEGFADALSAAALAGAHRAPVILTEGGRLTDAARDEVVRLGATRIIILGGAAAVSEATEQSLRQLADVERIAGTDRAATSVESLRLARSTHATSDTVIIASGSSFADALSIGPWSWKTVSPIVLAQSGLLTEGAMDAIRADAGIRRVLIVGGTSCVSDQVRDQLGSAFEYVRLGGADRFETSALVAAWCSARDLTWSRPVVATGTNFADALAGASLAGKTSSPLLLVGGEKSATIDELRTHRGSVSSVVVLGGTSAVSTATERAVLSAVS